MMPPPMPPQPPPGPPPMGAPPPAGPPAPTPAGATPGGAGGLMQALQTVEGPLLYLLAGAGIPEMASAISKMMNMHTKHDLPAQGAPPPAGPPKLPTAPLPIGGGAPNPLAQLAQRG